MKTEAIKAAVAEAKRFITRAETLLNTEDQRMYGYGSPKESGACRRASLDLTRALAEMRKP